MRHDFCDGKYTVVFEDDGRLHALRYGETWRDLAGDKMVLSMLQAFDSQQKQLARAAYLLNLADGAIDECWELSREIHRLLSELQLPHELITKQRFREDLPT